MASQAGDQSWFEIEILLRSRSVVEISHSKFFNADLEAQYQPPQESQGTKDKVLVA